MSNAPQRNVVKARESGFGPFGQYINVGHHILGADEPGTYGGQDTGPDPFELVMAGLAACTTMTIRMVAGRKKIALDDVSVEVRHLRAPVMSMGADPAPTVFVKGARYDKMMEAFGGIGANVTTPEELSKALTEGIASGKPTLINVVIDENAGTESGRIAHLNPQSAAKKK